MKIHKETLHPNEFSLTTGQIRSTILLRIENKEGDSGFGEIAPLPKWSRESLEESIDQFYEKESAIIAIDWTMENYIENLLKLELLPSLSFALESALLALIDPLPEFNTPISALLMGSPKEILQQAKQRHAEGFISAKLKIGNLSFAEATSIIQTLKTQFRLRIDVNRAWTTPDALTFFSQFPMDTFDYVEEPFQNPHDLHLFSHPLAIDESFPSPLSLKDLEQLPTLKALIYKPTLQGGISACMPLIEWTKKRGVEFVLSSSFESDCGIFNINSMAYRLALSAPVGVGTYHFINRH
jgi:o-succinylbenzoate synthase